MPGQRNPSTKPSESDEPKMAAEELPDEPNTGTGISARSMIKTVVFSSFYIVVSAVLVRFNKHIMHQQVFPHAVALSAMHMSMTCFLCYVFYFIKPSLYPAMASIQGQRMTMFKYFIPLGFLFAISVSTSNAAYFYCSVTFLQFIKQANVVLVFGLGVLGGMQQCSRSKMFVLAWILLGVCMAVQGEVNFIILGLMIQLSSQVCECCKIVFGEWLMTSSLKLDPLTYTMFLAPISTSILLVVTACTWKPEIFVHFLQFWHLILPNACLAFVLNVSIAVLIKECGAVTLILSGLIRDMGLVLISIFFFGESATPQQFVGFAVCLAGVGFWSVMRIDPNATMVKGLKESLGEVEQADKSELKQLLEKKTFPV